MNFQVGQKVRVNPELFQHGRIDRGIGVVTEVSLGRFVTVRWDDLRATNYGWYEEYELVRVVDEVFQLRDGWYLSFNGVVPTTTWQERGPAEAQLQLLQSGYSELCDDGTHIRHVGGMAKFKRILEAQDWVDKNAFGACCVLQANARLFLRPGCHGDMRLLDTEPFLEVQR